MAQSDEVKHEACPSCTEKWLKLVEESRETFEDSNGVKQPAYLYYECERCKAKWIHDVLGNTWSERS